MALSTRLERLRKLVQEDVHALPKKSAPLVPGPASDEHGGLALEPEQSQAPWLPDSSKRVVATDEADCSAKPAVKPTISDDKPDRRFVWLQDAQSSYNPNSTSMPPASLPQPTKISTTHLHRGDLVSPRYHFTPIQALAKYPYKFCSRDTSQGIASAFFDQGKFWEREWELYYVWDIEPGAKPVVLVRESQVHTLLSEINCHLKLALRITDQQREEGLVAHFPDHPRCLPRYLGRSQSRGEYDNMVDNIPSHSHRAEGESSHPPLEPSTHELFRQLMDDLYEVQKAKNKISKAKKQQDRLGKQKAMTDHFKRAQRYLGLRANREAEKNSSSEHLVVNVAKPVPFVFDQSVVFVCVDVESYEHAHHKITEVGIATLDTRDLAGIEPGVDGKQWSKRIRARHFRINEHRHLVNGSFVSGYPDKFKFGESTFIPLKEAAQHIADCFSTPFGAHSSNGAGSAYTLIPSKFDVEEKRNLIFLGHDTSGDIQYLQKLGYDATKVDNIIEALDTAVMYQVWRRESQPTRLTKILDSFDLDGFYAHNAGNDAVFTVQAMLAICVREATLRGSSSLDEYRNKVAAARLVIAVEEAHERIKSEEDGWNQLEVEGDGGGPIPLMPSNVPSSGPTHNISRAAPNMVRGRDVGRGNTSRGRGATASQHNGNQYMASHRSRGGTGRGQLDGSGRHARTRARERGNSNAVQPSNTQGNLQVRYSDLI
ncbi:hypothetical protein LEMA_P099110.1 [Plenodomus lingam JN3]|uniref:Gfd2/YDR514C-like C-terminal domain-containing protein n=1 Tax=Leptosphaeria maculans (strain JN3 / isolate v23.1.3 / race Av1-4-5-6-7-8) TaxID=985895 RepID=E4ZZS0_LEPMJ|nr:hypothetical protein LEMA_P099110.1 [Plenodomus lingam JN3]CBX96780.1 hypothetical protein LEMA_P099110.1 [Plenodomus lingam JN3]